MLSNSNEAAPVSSEKASSAGALSLVSQIGNYFQEPDRYKARENNAKAKENQNSTAIS